MKKSFSFPIIFMVLLTALFTFVLAVLNYQTIDLVAFNQETELRKVILNVFDLDVPSDPIEIENTFNKYIVKESDDENSHVYLYREGAEFKGYAFPVGGPGLWGAIEAYVGVSEDYSTLLGMDFTEQNETPGLGGRIGEDWFKEQFRNIDISDFKGGEFLIFRPAPNGNVDAVTGATQTSVAVSKFLNEDIMAFINARKGVN